MRRAIFDLGLKEKSRFSTIKGLTPTFSYFYRLFVFQHCLRSTQYLLRREKLKKTKSKPQMEKNANFTDLFTKMNVIRYYRFLNRLEKLVNITFRRGYNTTVKIFSIHYKTAFILSEFTTFSFNFLCTQI